MSCFHFWQDFHVHSRPDANHRICHCQWARLARCLVRCKIDLGSPRVTHSVVVTQISRLTSRQAYRELCIRFNLGLSRHTTPQRCWAVEQGSGRWELTKISSKSQVSSLAVSCLREDRPALAKGKHYSCANMALSGRGGKSNGCKQFACVDTVDM